MATYGFDEKKNLVEVPSKESFKVKPGDSALQQRFHKNAVYTRSER